ncbi:MAG: single-stranded DNA-binding protein [Planctomycetota bacterium]|jgi:single-strand DNA-binding protein
MANYNRVILVGNLTRDPQMSYLPSQTPVVEIGLAVNRRWRSKEGEQREDTCFIDCTAFGRQAETLNQYVKKGNPLLVEGRLQLDRWEGQDGQKHSKHRVIIENFQFLGSAGGGRTGAPSRTGAAKSEPSQQPKADGAPATQPDPYEQSGAEEIPF